MPCICKNIKCNGGGQRELLNLLENKLCSLTWQITHCQSPKGSVGCGSLAGTWPHPRILLRSSLQFTFSVVWASTLKFPGGAGESEIIKGTGSSQLQEQGKVHALGRPIGWMLEGRPARVLGVLGNGDRFLLTQVREDFLEEGH